MSAERPIDILLVEDSPTDVLLTRAALDAGTIAHRLHVVSDGDEALAFVRRQAPHPQAPRPELLLLDLNLPGTDGRQVLRQLKEDPGLRTIPVVVLTTSQDAGDVLAAYGAHANCYIRKPVDFADFRRIVGAIEQFWFTVVSLPSRTAP